MKRNKVRAGLLFIVIFISSFSAFVVNVRAISEVEGYVLDAETYEGIFNVYVTIYGKREVNGYLLHSL